METQYLFIDTETTGIRPSVDRIINIAFCEVVNNEIVSEWNQYINPEMTIPSSIYNLTGINNEMLANAPTFTDIAATLSSKLKNQILVAHNARFDYAFLMHEMKRAGIKFNNKIICTLKLSRMLFPQHKSHNLDAILTRFNIPITHRHNALQDARLLVDVFKSLAHHVEAETLHSAIKKSLKENSIPAHLPKNLINKIPTHAGVYLFYGKNQTLLYIGKSNSLRDRVLSHFSSDYISSKQMQMVRQIKDVKWINTAGELGALLKEAQLIKKHKPIFNRQLRRHKNLFSIQLTPQTDSYHQLKITAVKELCSSNLKNTYGLFRNKMLAETKLRELTKDYYLCPKLCGLEKTHKACFYYQIHKCKGACIGKESFIEYNQRLESTIKTMKYRTWPYTGKIAIKELCKQKKTHDFHIIEDWCYLGTTNTLAEINTIEFQQNKLDFDIDIYRLLVKYLLVKQANIEVVELAD